MTDAMRKAVAEYREATALLAEAARQRDRAKELLDAAQRRYNDLFAVAAQRASNLCAAAAAEPDGEPVQ